MWKETKLRTVKKCKNNSKLASREAVVQRCSVKKVFLEISQNSQENTCTRVSFIIKLQACEFYEISKNTFSYRTHPAAVSASNMICEETLLHQYDVNFAKKESPVLKVSVVIKTLAFEKVQNV